MARKAQAQAQRQVIGTATYQFDGNETRKRMAGYAHIEGHAAIAGAIWIDKRALPEGAMLPETITVTVAA